MLPYSLMLLTNSRPDKSFLYIQLFPVVTKSDVQVPSDSLTRTTLKSPYIMNASCSGEESPEETNGPPKDMTTNESPTYALEILLDICS